LRRGTREGKGKKDELEVSSLQSKIEDCWQMSKREKAYLFELSMDLILVGATRFSQTILNPLPARRRSERGRGQLERKERRGKRKERDLLERGWPRSVVHLG